MGLLDGVNREGSRLFTRRDWMRTAGAGAARPRAGLALVLLAALASVAAAQNDINAAVAAGDWPIVERMALDRLARGPFDYGYGRLYVLSLSRQDRAVEAAEMARQWATDQNGAAGAVVLADALIAAGYYGAARAVLRDLSRATPETEDAARYLDSLRERAAKRVYRLRWQILAEEAATMPEEWFAPPQDTANQRLLDLRVEGAEATEETRDEHGNRLLRLRPLKNGPIIVTALVELTPMSARDLYTADGDVAAEVTRYLSSSPGIEVDARELLAELPDAGTASLGDRVQWVMRWANRRLTYCPPGSPPGPDTSTDVIRRGGGHCEAISSAEAASLRALGVPARLIRGQSAIVGERGVMKQHTIVEYWLPSVGWVDWDHNRPDYDMRADFVRLCSYESVGDAAVQPGFYFQGREFSGPGEYRNGPYGYELVGTSLD